jgi:hypothetical protein
VCIWKLLLPGRIKRTKLATLINHGKWIFKSVQAKVFSLSRDFGATIKVNKHETRKNGGPEGKEAEKQIFGFNVAWELANMMNWFNFGLHSIWGRGVEEGSGGLTLYGYNKGHLVESIKNEIFIVLFSKMIIGKKVFGDFLLL